MFKNNAATIVKIQKFYFRAKKNKNSEIDMAEETRML